NDWPAPSPRLGESLIRVRMAGICGTDLELARGYMGYRGVPGHEFVGEVVESETTAIIGSRVAGEINAGCRDCEPCLAGLQRHCANRTVLGILGRDGAFADFLTLPDENLVALPDAIPDELAVFVEPVAAAYEIFEQTHLSRNERILVLGDGRLGALVGLALWAEAYTPVVGGHHADKLELLAALGLQTVLDEHLEPAFDTIIDCTGNPDGFRRALELVRPRGRIILKSTAASAGELNLAPIVINEVTIVGSRCGRFAPAVEAIASGKIDPRPLISAMYPLSDALAAFEAARDPQNFKVLLKID
ncbi:MAG TPA: alcohol dehydrogenase catalytic domain-containing protein, partial [Candidatus Binataceae bacterium]|nr:alcohol dehydrogenase catalytic domain-containing protein [Candidatus Binataceae bacterium]